jgi:hypothetical protein
MKVRIYFLVRLPPLLSRSCSLTEFITLGNLRFYQVLLRKSVTRLLKYFTTKANLLKNKYK